MLKHLDKSLLDHIQFGCVIKQKDKQEYEQHTNIIAKAQVTAQNIIQNAFDNEANFFAENKLAIEDIVNQIVTEQLTNWLKTVSEAYQQLLKSTLETVATEVEQVISSKTVVESLLEKLETHYHSEAKYQVCVPEHIYDQLLQSPMENALFFQLQKTEENTLSATMGNETLFFSFDEYRELIQTRLMENWQENKRGFTQKWQETLVTLSTSTTDTSSDEISAE